MSDDIKRLKLIELFENTAFHKHSKRYAVHKSLLEHLEENEETQDTKFKELQEIVFYLRRRIVDKYDIHDIVAEGQHFPVHTPKPTSCFSLPAYMRIQTVEAGIFQGEDYLLHVMGKKVLNEKTKDHYIDKGKYLYLKIDLTFNKADITKSVDDIVQHAQSLIGKERPARGMIRHSIFDNIFSEFILDMRRLKTLEETSHVLLDKYKMHIDSDSLLRKYYPERKKRRGISNLKTWKKEQRGTNK